MNAVVDANRIQALEEELERYKSAERENRYIFPTILLRRVLDGDTIDVDVYLKKQVDLGFGIFVQTSEVAVIKLRIRFFNVAAPEVRGPEKEAGLASKEALINFIRGKRLKLETIKYKGGDKKGSFSRYLGVLWADNVNVNEWLIENGHATEYKKK